MKVWAVANQKGGVGKTTTSIALAGLLADAGKRVVVVDLDPHADATTGLGAVASSSADAGSVLNGRVARSGARAAAVPSAWIEREHAAARDTGRTSSARLDVLPGSSSSSRLDRSTFRGKDLDRLSRALEGLDTDYDLVLVDCPPNLNALTRLAWAASDMVLTVAEPSLFSVAGAQRIHTALGPQRVLTEAAPPRNRT